MRAVFAVRTPAPRFLAVAAFATSRGFFVIVPFAARAFRCLRRARFTPTASLGVVGRAGRRAPTGCKDGYGRYSCQAREGQTERSRGQAR